MEIVQMQSHDAQESLAKVILHPPPPIKMPRPEFADEVDPSIQEEKKGEEVTEEEERSSGNQVQEQCTTPNGEASRIPAASVCPPPPARRTRLGNKRRREIPSEDFFPVPVDLNSVFVPRKKIRAS